MRRKLISCPTDLQPIDNTMITKLVGGIVINTASYLLEMTYFHTFKIAFIAFNSLKKHHNCHNEEHVVQGSVLLIAIPSFFLSFLMVQTFN